MATRVRVAVLGVGSLGQQHARIYAEMHRQDAVELVGVYDTDPAQAKAIAEKHDTTALGSIEAAAAAADALSIVTPTVTHHTLAKPLLDRLSRFAKDGGAVESPEKIERVQPTVAEIERLVHRHAVGLHAGQRREIRCGLDAEMLHPARRLELHSVENRNPH